MGARTNWELTVNGKSLFLYSHSGGETKFTDTQRALRNATPRLSMDDYPYSLRIFVSQIVGDEWSDSTGFGLSLVDEFEEHYAPAKIDFTKREITYNGITYKLWQFLQETEETYNERVSKI